MAEIDSGIHLVVESVQIGSQGNIVVEEAAGAHRIDTLAITYVGDLGPVRRGIRHIKVLVAAAAHDAAAVVEIDEVGDALVNIGGSVLIGGAVADATVAMGEQGAAVIKHLKAVRARSASLKVINLSDAGGLGDRDELHRIAGSKGQCATCFGEVYSSESR